MIGRISIVQVRNFELNSRATHHKGGNHQPCSLVSAMSIGFTSIFCEICNNFCQFVLIAMPLLSGPRRRRSLPQPRRHLFGKVFVTILISLQYFTFYVILVIPIKSFISPSISPFLISIFCSSSIQYGRPTVKEVILNPDKHHLPFINTISFNSRSQIAWKFDLIICVICMGYCYVLIAMILVCRAMSTRTPPATTTDAPPAGRCRRPASPSGVS